MSSIMKSFECDNLRVYLGAIIKKFGYLRFLGVPSFHGTSVFPIETLFVPSKLSDRRFINNNIISTQPEVYDIFDSLSLDKSRVIILGDAGCGKTTLANWVMWRLATGQTRSLPSDFDGLLPVPLTANEINFQNLRGFHSLIEKFFKTDIGKLIIEFDAKMIFRHFMESRRILFVVDGVDEIDHNSKIKLKSAIQEGWEIYDTNRWLLTSNFENYDYRSSGPLLPKTLDESKTHEMVDKTFSITKLCYVAPFNNIQINEFISNWYGLKFKANENSKNKASALAKEIHRIIENHYIFRLPQILFLTAATFHFKGEFNNNRSILYSEIVRIFLKSVDDYNNKNEDYHSLLSYEIDQKIFWFAQVGFEVKIKFDSSPDSYEHLCIINESDIVDYMVNASEKFSLLNKETATRYLTYISERNGFIVSWGKKKYAFLHSLFQEYFAAVYLYKHIHHPEWIKTGVSKDQRVSHASFKEWSSNTIWHETLIFLFELLSNEIGWVEQLVDVVFEMRMDNSNFYHNEQEGFFSNPRGSLLAKIVSNKNIIIPVSLKFHMSNLIFLKQSEKISNKIFKTSVIDGDSNINVWLSEKPNK